MNDAASGWWTRTDDGIELTVRVVPGARRSEIADVADAHLRVRINAPAVDGKANAELRRFLAEWCGVRPSAVDVVSGDRGRMKRVRVVGVYAPPATTMF